MGKSKADALARLGRVPRVKAQVYEGAANSRRTLGWRAPTTYPNQVLGDLAMLRDRSRGAVRNDGFAKGAIDKLVSNIIGTGMKPLCQSDDEAFRKQAEELWTAWTDESDADGNLDFYGQQALAVRCWLEAGEAFVRLRPRLLSDGLTVPLQLQVLEPEQCPLEYTAVAANGNRIRAGIEFNKIGRRVAYYFYLTRPGDPNEMDMAKLVRVPAASVIHLYKPMRPGQLRGIPHLTQALIRLRELDKYADATLLRQQLSAMFVAFLKNMQGENAEALTGEESTVFEGERPVLALEPGAFQTLSPGEEVQFSDPPDVPAGYEDYMRGHLYAVSAATGVPYEVLTGDMSRVNDRTVRVILHEFRRQIGADQHQTVAFQLCRPVWSAWMDAAVECGALVTAKPAPVPAPVPAPAGGEPAVPAAPPAPGAPAPEAPDAPSKRNPFAALPPIPPPAPAGEEPAEEVYPDPLADPLAAAQEAAAGADYFTDPSAWSKVLWMPQGWPYINPVQDVQAAKEAIRNGLTSRSAVIAETGEDASTVDAQQAKDNQRADDLGLTYDSDGRSSGGSGGGGFGAPAAPPMPPAAPPAEPGEEPEEPEDPEAPVAPAAPAAPPAPPIPPAAPAASRS